MIVQRSLAETIASERQFLRARVPKHKGEIADQTIKHTVAPAFETVQQDSCVTELRVAAGQQAEIRNQLIAIVEPNVGNKSKSPITAV